MLLVYNFFIYVYNKGNSIKNLYVWFHKNIKKKILKENYFHTFNFNMKKYIELNLFFIFF